MENKMNSRLMLVICLGLASASLISARPRTDVQPAAVQHIQKEVRHELILLPFVTVFDNLGYQVNGSDVTLVGQVRQPSLKDEAENVVKKIEGVTHINNQIEVLSESPFDSTLRLRLFRAIYDYSALQRYALDVNKPIRIIVNRGHVRLEGVVDNQVDKSIVGIRAKSVPESFSVDNNLQIAKQK
jgi:hyperosmotically inducible protein